MLGNSVGGWSTKQLVAEVLMDPPVVHPHSATGVLSSEASCYELLASRCHGGSWTLETGLGVSTAIFCLRRTRHVCVAYTGEEVERFRAWADARQVSTDQITFLVGSSHEVLPGLEGPALDAFFIDGCHGFPLPMVDWLYGAGRLRRGGLLAVDDLQLPAVAILADFLDRDPRWTEVGRSEKWVGYDRVGEGPILEDWWAQKDFFPGSARSRGHGRGLFTRLVRAGRP